MGFDRDKSSNYQRWLWDEILRGFFILRWIEKSPGILNPGDGDRGF